LLTERGKHQWAHRLHDDVRLVRFAPPELEIAPVRPLGADFHRDLGAWLKGETGQVWRIADGEGPAEPTLKEQESTRENAARDAILASPNVRAIIEAFPEAELVGWTDNRSAA
jgi:DNA polymerase III subunit gamma/tau